MLVGAVCLEYTWRSRDADYVKQISMIAWNGERRQGADLGIMGRDEVVRVVCIPESCSDVKGRRYICIGIQVVVCVDGPSCEGVGAE